MINTERLSLVPIDIKYANDLYEIWSDYEVVKYTYLAPIKSQEECYKRIEMLLNHTDTEFTNNFIVILKGKAIGVAGFPIIQKDPFECRFYYHYGRKYWGNGYATEVAKKLQEYIFNQYPNAVIKADAVSINAASMHVLNNLGFHQTYIEELGFQNNGFHLDLVHFTSIRSM